jgi:hypothetical protein
MIGHRLLLTASLLLTLIGTASAQTAQLVTPALRADGTRQELFTCVITHIPQLEALPPTRVIGSPPPPSITVSLIDNGGQPQGSRTASELPRGASIELQVPAGNVPVSVQPAHCTFTLVSVGAASEFRAAAAIDQPGVGYVLIVPALP